MNCIALARRGWRNLCLLLKGFRARRATAGEPSGKVQPTVQQQKLATIEDVAAIAGVSIATVSRAINEPTKVADETRRKVNEAIARTGYTTNAMARSLRMRRSNMILIMAPDVGDLGRLVDGAADRGDGYAGNRRNVFDRGQFLVLQPKPRPFWRLHFCL